ncbi:MAG: FAD-binding protein, partial [Clostridiales bacterium]|nr:FAD-binding protein [Clostridiales bacterium]
MAKEGRGYPPEGLFEEQPAAEFQGTFPGKPPVIDEKLITEEVETDVLVLGGGHAGLHTALAACEGGARVAVVERRTEEKMTWIGEQIGTFNSRFLTARGFGGYNLDDIIEEFDRCAVYRNNHRLIEKYVRNSGEALDHLLSLIPKDSDILDPDQYNIHQAYGNPTYPIARGGYRTWAATIQFRGKMVDTRDIDYPIGKFSRLKDICKIVLKRTQELGAEWYFGRRVVLLTQDEKGSVTGALAKNPDGSYTRFIAHRGVALCLGNFGDAGLRLALWAGAHLDNTPVNLISSRMPEEGSRPFGKTAFLLLNAQGKRFVNESVPYALPPALERQPGGFFTMVTDRNWKKQTQLCGVHHGSPDFGRPEFIAQVEEDMSHVVAHGAEGYAVRNLSLSEREQAVCYGAETLDELAGYLGYSGKAKETWLASIERYNRMCRQKYDSDFGKDPEELLPVEEGPFYGRITKIQPVNWADRSTQIGQMTGLHTDDDFRLLDKNLEPIPGLYTVGA